MGKRRKRRTEDRKGRGGRMIGKGRGEKGEEDRLGEERRGEQKNI